ncbi:CLAVATA3/ESR (CLE)-related protein 27-like [Raphanus sativus]|uniref:CLAVATA3/ESR (CLE)-related protein 27-like n=1 Tax=Raphanus sativus TaxID=3726 RepID=A0A6J0M1V9_RAPSA|nr:CLAVATA3/ESR (CLE)-related protein 27-like [Raphanus sativus]
MSHACEWRSSSLLMVIFLSSLLYLLSVNTRIGAIRVFVELPTTLTTSHAPANNQEDPMKKHSGTGKFAPVDSSLGKGFGDSKRPVPSGPDPLHN